MQNIICIHFTSYYSFIDYFFYHKIMIKELFNTDILRDATALMEGYHI